MVPNCKTFLQLPNAEINYDVKKKSHANKLYQVNCSYSTHQETVNIIKKLKDKGKQPVAALGLNEFIIPTATDPAEDIELTVLIYHYMTRLYDADSFFKSLDFFLNKFELETFQINAETAELIEHTTRKQHQSPYWFKIRLGRITASIFKSVCRANIQNSFPPSLLKNICYPEVFNTAATDYGRRMEKTAIEFLLQDNKAKHKNLKLSPIGFVVDINKCYYGASPDAMWNCRCCENAPVEVKCPFNFRNGDITAYLATKSCSIILNDSNLYEIKKNHAYYYQVQLQLYILKKKFAHFFVYSKEQQILIKVPFDGNFVEEQLKKTDLIFKTYIYPELVGKYYTNIPV